jgi:UDP-N-acetylglucosamine acyltransferase
MEINQLKKSILKDNTYFVLVDKILEIDNSRIVAIKNISLNEPFFSPDSFTTPELPHTLLIEAMVQTSRLLISHRDDLSGRKACFSALKKINFKKTVQPGDQIRLETRIKKVQKNSLELSTHILLEGQIICEGILVFTLTHIPSRPQIHHTASVHPSAVLGRDVVVGPYTIIGENVIIRDRTILEAHVMVEKWAKIGSDCHLHFGCVIGSAAQDIKYTGEEAWVVIGDRNEIREYVTINRSTGKNSKTEIGSDNLIFTNVHIGHNCKIGNNVVIVNMTHIAGHVTIEDRAIIGGMTGIHQFARIGQGAMIGGYSRLSQDVPPFMMCAGSPAYIRGVNVIGLKRRGVNLASVKEIKEIYRILFRSGLNTSQAIEKIKAHKFKDKHVKYLLNFITTDSKRGFAKKVEKEDAVEI